MGLPAVVWPYWEAVGPYNGRRIIRGVTMSHMSTLVTIHCWLRVDEHVKINRNFFLSLVEVERNSIHLDCGALE